MARRGRLLVFVALASSAALVACSLLTGLNADYTLQTAGAEAGKDGDTPGDGPGDGPGADGATDALPDTTPLRDTGVDGAFCDGIDAAFLDFCDDFEDPTLKAGVPVLWKMLMNSADASVKIKPGLGMDGSAGLEVDTQSASTASRQIWLNKVLPASQGLPTQYLSHQLDFDFRVDVSDLNYEAVGVLNFTNATPEDHGVAAYVGDLLGRLTPKSTGVPNGLTWHHARVKLQHAAKGTPFDSVITIDGVEVDNTTGVSTANTSVTEVRMGLFYTTNAAGHVHATFDNVVARRTY